VKFLRNARDLAVQRTLWLHRITQVLYSKGLVLPFLLAASCLFAQPAFGQSQESDSGHNRVHGTVINAVTHDPIGRALVHSSDSRFAALTDSGGRFEFEWPGSDSGISFWLSARRPGFLDEPGESTQVRASPGSEITISLLPEGVIKGRVMLSTGDAAAGIPLQLFSKQVRDGISRWVQGTSTRADSNGEFRFAELLPGAYKVLTNELMDNDPVVTSPGAQLYGFPPVYYPSAPDFAGASTIQLAAGQTFQADLSPVRQPYYPVRIPVTNAEPNNGTNVTVSPQGHRGPGYSLGYNPEKQRIEGLLPNGNYLVEASAFGQNGATGAVNLAVVGSSAEGASMALIRSGSIIVNVKEEFTSTDWNASGSWSNGRRTFIFHGPRTYLQISVEPADDFESQGGRGVREPTGPDDESLVIENVPPGRYWLRPYSSRGYVSAASIGGVDLLHQPLIVGPGASTTIDVTMRDDGAEIEGTVAGVSAGASAAANTSPMIYTGKSPFPTNSSAYVYCVPLPESSGQLKQFGISSDGKFGSQSMAPGTYRVLAFKNAQPNLPYRDPEAMRPYDSKGQVVHLSPGQKATVQLQIVPSE
jgi:hypothetical protein